MSNPHKPPTPLWKVIGGVALAVAVLVAVLSLANRAGGASSVAAPAPVVTASPAAAAPTVVPNLVGLTDAQAVSELLSIEPHYQVSADDDSGNPAATVVSQTPVAGTPLTASDFDTVELHMSDAATNPAPTLDPTPPTTDTSTPDSSASPDSGSSSGGDHYIPHPHVHACVGGKHVHVCS